MALLERVTALIRANLNELIERAEQPETMIRQIMRDMENQLIQVKTQVAISIADQHMLEKKLAESRESEQQWLRRAEMALDKGDDSLARAAAARAVSSRSIAENFAQQVEDQKAQVENLKNALLKLQDKLAEATAKSELLIAQHRRSRLLEKAARARNGGKSHGGSSAFERMKEKTDRAKSAAEAAGSLAADNADARFAAMESDNEIDRLIRELKARRNG